MKFMKNIWCIMFFALLIMFSTTAYAAEIISPANGAVGVMPGESLTVRYSEAVNIGEKMITVNDSEENIDSVVAEDDILTVNYKNMDYGKRYKTVIKNNLGETELVTFFNTGFTGVEVILGFNDGNMDTLWNGRATGGATVTADVQKLHMISTSDGSYGGRINTTDFSINASDSDEIVLKVASQQDVDFKIYFSAVGGNRGFSSSFDTISIKGGGEFKEYRIPAFTNADWTGEIKQFLFEQTTTSNNTIAISSFEVTKVSNLDTYIGDFELYRDYGTEFEGVVTGQTTTAGQITASLEAVQSTEEESVYLIIAKYRDGVMTGANVANVDISDGQLYSPITVSIDAEAGETVKAFLRKAKNDIRVIKNCILTTIE